MKKLIKYILLIPIIIVGIFLATGKANAVGNVYYLDCNGNDTNSGLSSALPWKSLSKVNSFNFQAGDQILMKKGCTWNGTFTLTESGTSADNIRVGSYGDGELPIVEVTTSSASSFNISGSNITLDGVFTRAVSTSLEVGCQNQPKGSMNGVAFQSGAAYNTLKNSKLTGAYAGVYLMSGSHHNKVMNNIFTDNNMMSRVDTTADNDAGAFGVLIWGDDNEIGNNLFSGMDACSYDYVRDGSAVEIYGGQRNLIHHNKASKSDAFTELGNSRSSDNTYFYNLFYSTNERSIFLVTRGSGSGYGPVNGTKMFNNTVYLTGASSQGFVCHGGCNATVFNMKNNIIQAAGKVGYADGAFDNSNNLYYQGQVQFTMGSGDVVSDPQFVDVSKSDFHIKSTSPAKDKGNPDILDLGIATDLDQNSVPVNGIVDIGAYEFGSLSEVLSPTPSSAPLPLAGNGDVNGDGTVNFIDIISISTKWLFALTDNFDQYRDGKINSLDLAVVIQKMSPIAPTLVPTITVAPTATPTPTSAPDIPTATPMPPTPTPSGTDPMLISVGDIARTTGSPSSDVANAIKSANPDVILMVGDYDQGTGTLADILSYPDKLYGPKPGGLYPKMYSTAGPTHDVASATDQLGYQQYWGRDAFTPYSFDVGTWHIVSMPSAAFRYSGVTPSPASSTTWLQNDLATHKNLCTLIFWHEPYFTIPTSSHGSNTSVKPWVDAAVAGHADVLISGHQNGDFMAFSPQNSSFQADPNGIVQYVTAIGGQSPYAFTGTASNLISSSSGAYGVFKMFLHPAGWDWSFAKVAGSGAAPSPSSGTGTCH